MAYQGHVNYKGYRISESSGGGKAGKGRNKTASIRVLQNIGVWVIRKTFRFDTHDILGRAKAIDKAKNHIDELCKKPTTT